MSRKLPPHEIGCGGKLVLPVAIFKDADNRTTHQYCVNGRLESRWCTVCMKIVPVEMKQKS